MEARAARAARNESVFREVNERVKDVNDRFETVDGMFFCECSNPGCAETFAMTAADYERLRARGDQFALIRGHDDPAIERVVEERVDYVVVQKLAEGATVAERLDPRG